MTNQEKLSATITQPLLSRNFEFIGDHTVDSIVLGNYADAKITAKGNFFLSGIIYCKKHTVEISLDGVGTVSFTGVCRNFVIRSMVGNCTLDLSNLACETVRCLSAKGESVIILGYTKVIEELNLDNNASLKYSGRPVMASFRLDGNSKI